MSKKVTRLFNGFHPVNYQLRLELEPDKRKFKGNVIIKGKKIGRPSQRITLHQKDLNIESARLTKHDKKSSEDIVIARINRHKSFDEVRLHSDSLLYPGDYTIELSFDGIITDPMNGLYPCYFNHDDTDKILLATQFESHHAREVFPCIDEPEAKATFDLTIITPDDGSTVLSNTNVKEQKTKDNQVCTTFETTPVMSSYLLAFVVGEIDFKQATTNSGITVRTYATPDNVKLTDFALDTAVKCLEFYEQYFDIKYPLDKCEMIALPDFSSGAMENWGLITYRESCMLVDPDNTSIGVKQYVAMVVAHELAHQWFGNLVTMKWWTDLWLNEGFASWIEYLALDNLYPEWDMWTQFVTDEQQPALKLDALENTHAIEVEINHPDEIRSIFDAISYNKGASVIHMLHGYLGPEAFRDGLRAYLKKHQNKNTITNDLWQSLEDISGKPVRDFMHEWTSLPGFPLLSVEQKNQQISLKQTRFYMQKPEVPSNKTWPIPTLVSSEYHLPESFNSHEQNTDITVKTLPKFNKDQNGFYRTIYPVKYLSSLTEAVSSMSPLDRLGLLADSFETAKVGYSSSVDSFNLLEKYSAEDNATVWDIIAVNIGETRRVMDDDSIRESIKPYIVNLTKKQLDRLGNQPKDQDTYFDKLLRPTILGLSASADQPDIKQWCIETFDRTAETSQLNPDFRSVIFNTAARFGDNKTYDKLLDFHNSTNLSEERTTLSAALTSFEQTDLINRSLQMITSKNVRRQDAMYWLAYSLVNRHAKRTTWQWIQDNWQWLDKELGGDLSFYRIPVYVARSFSGDKFIEDYNKFFLDKSSPVLDRSIKQGLEILNWQTNWRKRDLEPLQAFFANQTNTQST